MRNRSSGLIRGHGALALGSTELDNGGLIIATGSLIVDLEPPKGPRAPWSVATCRPMWDLGS